MIDDAALNARWILVPNAQYPAGPSHWVLAGNVPPKDQAVPADRQQAAKVTTAIKMPDKPKVLVHTGDIVTVLHETKSSRLELQAKALANAAEGGKLRVRLSTGGVVEAVATAPGRVDLVPEFFSRREP